MSAASTIEATAFNEIAYAPFDSLFRISVEMYHEMIKKGILSSDDRVELIEGILVKKMAKNEPHIFATGQLLDLLPKLVKTVGFVNNQDPIVFSDSEPEPDITIVRGTRQEFRARKPEPPDILLLIEVSDTTLLRDQGPRKRLFARELIQQYWIVNLIDGQIEVYTQPSGPATTPDYGDRQIFPATEIVPVILDGKEVGSISVKDLL